MQFPSCSTLNMYSIPKVVLFYFSFVAIGSHSRRMMVEGSTSGIISVPSVYPIINGGSPVAAAQPGDLSWCVAKGGLPEASLQAALDYACGIGGVDCSAIQQGAQCYDPDTLQSHASYAFNSYFQRNMGQLQSCDFGGTAVITHVNPSSGSCTFASISPSSSSPSTAGFPTSTNPGVATTGGLVGSNNPPLPVVVGGGVSNIYPSPPTTTDTSSVSSSTSHSSQSLIIGCVVAVISVMAAKFLTE